MGDVSGIVDVDVRALPCDTKAFPELLGLIVDVLERTRSRRINELAMSVRIAEPWDSEEVDLVTELLLYLYDRRGFCTSKWSPGRPEP